MALRNYLCHYEIFDRYDLYNNIINNSLQLHHFLMLLLALLQKVVMMPIEILIRRHRFNHLLKEIMDHDW